MRRAVRIVAAAGAVLILASAAFGVAAATDGATAQVNHRSPAVTDDPASMTTTASLAADSADGNGTITVDVHHDGSVPFFDGERATEVNALVVHRDGDTSEAYRVISDRHWNASEDRLVDVPKTIELPAGHDYHVSAYVNDQFAGDTGWISLEAGESVDRDLTVENYVTITPQVYHSDGSTAIRGATVQVWSHEKQQNDSDGADPVVWRSGETNYDGKVKVPNGDGKLYLYPTEATDPGYYVVEVKKDGEEIAQRRVDDLTAARTEQITTNLTYSVTIVGYDPQTGTYDNTTVSSFDATTPSSSPSLPEDTSLAQYSPPGTVYTKKNNSAVPGRTEEYPWSAVGSLAVNFSSDQKPTPGCSATVVEDNHVITAAHCVTINGGWGVGIDPAFSSYTVFMPGRSLSSAPLGTFNITYVQIYERWAEWEPTSYDIAVLTLNESVGARTGTFGYESNSADSQRYVGSLHLTGYPSSLEADYVSNEYEQWDLIADGEDTDVLVGIEECRDFCHDYATGGLFDEAAVGGTSGAPVWRLDSDDLPSMVSVHSSTAGALLDTTKALSDGVGVRISERKASDLARMIERGDEMTVEVSPSQVDVGSQTILEVTVTDARTGEGIEDATVSLSGSADIEGRTDAEGFVAFAVSPSSSGRITVTASAPGYENETAPVVVGEGAVPTANDTFAGTAPGESVTAAFDASVSGGGDLSYAVDTPPTHGSVSIDGGQFTYTPESGFTGVDSFRYRATGVGGENDTGTVYVSVRSDDAAVIDGVVRDSRGNPVDDATVRVPLSGTDLTTTTDARGVFTLDLRDREHPSDVNVFVEATGYETITRVVAPADPGLLSVELTPVSESVLQLSSTLHHLGDGSYSGTINSQFQEPVEGSSFTTEFSLSSAQADPRSATLVYTARGVELDNRIYVNGENVGTMAETAADGSLSERQLSLSPSTLQAGENTLKIEAAENWIGDLDDFELSSIRLRIETAGTVQEPPTAGNVTVSTVRGSEVSGAFNATDPNADVESYSIETAPRHGSVTAVGGSFEYRPDAGFVGTDSFTYRVTDAAGNTDTATVEVVVEAGDTAPDFQVSALTAPATATVGEPVTVTTTVTNAGLTAGTQTVELTFDGSVVAARTLTLEPGQTGVVATSVTADSLGEFPVGVRTANDSRSTTVEFVNEAFVCGSSTGDPHFQTFDGTEYDFQGAGEFVLARSRGAREFEIQARHVPVADSVSSTTAVATAIDGIELMIDATDPTPLHVGGAPRSLDDGEQLAVGDGVVRRHGDTYTVVYPGPDGEVNGTDERLSATLWGDRLDVEVCLDEGRESTVEGLLGDLDGNPNDDIALADGTTLADPPSYEQLYGQFRSDWRVTESTSLFTYDAGESADSFYKPDFPKRRVTVDDLDPAARDRAERRARDAGLEPGTAAFRNAVIDFALTNETDYVASATTTTTVNATGGGGGVSATYRDLTGDGSRDIRLANGEVFFRIDGENVSGGLQVADAAGRVGAGQVLERLDALPTNPYSSFEKDAPTYVETVAFGVVADTDTRAAYRVVREYSYQHTGARVRIGWTLTLYNDSRYGIANLTITNVGSSPVEIDQDDGDIHDGVQVFNNLRLAGRSGTDSGYRFQLGDGDPRSFAGTGQWSTYDGTRVGTIYDSADAATVGLLDGTTPPHQWITEGDGAIGYHTDEVTLDPGSTASWRVAVAMHGGGSDAPATGRRIVTRAQKRPEVDDRVSTGPINASKLAIVPGGTGREVPLSNAWHYKQRLNRSVEGYEPPVWVYVLADNADFDATPSGDLPRPYTIENGDIVPRVGPGTDTEPTNDVYLVYKPGADRSQLKYLETRAGKDNSVVYGDRTLVENTDFAAENQVFYLPGVNTTGTGDDTGAALSFENGTVGSSTLPEPWTLAKDDGKHDIVDDRATHGSKSLYLTGSSGLDQSWATVEVDLTGVATIRGDVYVESNNHFAGDIKVHVDNVSGRVFGATQRETGRWHTDLEGSVARYDGVHTLILRTRGEDNRAYFDNIRFYDAAGDRLDAPSVVVSGGSGGGETAVDPTRTLPSTVAPGGEATITVTANASTSTVSFTETFAPAVDSATVERVTVDGLGTVTPLLANADEDGVVVTLDGLDPGATVTAEYSVSIPDGVAAGTTYAIDGNVSSGTTHATGTDRLTVRQSAFEGVAARYNADGNDVIDITELGAAASDYATSDLTIVELGEVAAAYAES